MPDNKLKVFENNWNKLNQRLSKEGSELVTKCHQLNRTIRHFSVKCTGQAGARHFKRRNGTVAGFSGSRTGS